MSERSDQILKASGLPDPSLAVLERGDALFVLTASTLLYHDESGTRRVTLRDLARIHSDQEGTLRVETPAGTALSASLVGFDPAEVQAFFRQVRDVTAQAKQGPAASPVPTTSTVPTASPTPGPVPSLTKSADPAPAPAARPVVHLPEQPQTVAGPAFPGVGTQGTAPASAPASAAASSSAPKVVTPPPPRRQAGGAPAGAAPASAPGTSSQKQAGQKAPAQNPGSQKQPPAPQAAPAPAASRPSATPSTVLPVPSGPAPTTLVAAAAPAEAPQAASLSTVSAPLGDAQADLLAQAGSVAGLGGRLRLLAVILMLAALGLAYFLYTAETPQPLNALWVIVAGGVGAVALTVLAALTRLLATLAQVVGSRGNGDG
ncbi:hypothetical protein [Deinococcus sp. Leaf326]|uniref:hypothetical protein n=1 Tax=Deinococcus sp. Leaf326 TaxID=1736338 RepID=UPI0006F677A7|nr:hypothetical protein [Deinococcus sp. Leaf326]KQQ99425.1 hypothetical protein ASF71_13725 [Deinococcus sp. Leaf326]